MSRTFYSEYVNHCLRFYARHDRPKFHSEADKHNCCLLYTSDAADEL